MKVRWIMPVCAALLLSGCGYIGEPMPPLLNIPVPVTGLSAVQHGDRIIVQFPVPRLNTQGTVLRSVPELDLRAGPGPNPFSMDTWAAQAKRLPEGPVTNYHARYEVPVDGWQGKDIVFAVRAIGPHGRPSEWSRPLAVGVVPPPPVPADVKAEAVPEGARLTWQAPAGQFRVWRQADQATSFSAVADTTKSEWIDPDTQYGKAYRYKVQSLVKTSTGGEAESLFSSEARITPVDIFPPEAPAALTAVASTASIELAWDRNHEPDLAGYRVYRAAPGGSFVKLADTGESPSYSDRNIEHGKVYRYAVTAVDRSGNESKMSAPVEATAP